MATPEIPHLGPGEGVQSVIDALDETGAVIVEGMIGESAREAILAELAPHVAAAPEKTSGVSPETEFFYRGTRNVTGLVAKSPAFVESLLLHPLLLGVAERLLADVCSSFNLNVAQFLVRQPDAPQQYLHRDEDVWAHLQGLLAERTPRPDVQLASVTALEEFRADGGATAVVPGSHRWVRDRQPEPQEIAYAVMPAGASVIYRGATLHGGGPNSLGAPRPGIHLSYVAGWLRTEEANILSTPPAVARTLPPRARQLVGYDIHDAIEIAGGYLGAVELADPGDLLERDELGDD